MPPARVAAMPQSGFHPSSGSVIAELGHKWLWGMGPKDDSPVSGDGRCHCQGKGNRRRDLRVQKVEFSHVCCASETLDV